MSGVIRSLLGLAEAVESSEGNKERTEQFRTALGHVDRLLQILPPGHELAAALSAEHARLRAVEGNTPRVERLRVAYTNIEKRLEACLALSMSEDSAAVDAAESIMNALVDEEGNPALMVCRGDAQSMIHLGATILAIFPNGMKLELTLRKAHPKLDEGIHEAGYWVIEGGVFASDGSMRRVDIEESIGVFLPRGIETRLKAHLRHLIARCASSVVTLVPHRAQAAEAARRAAGGSR